MDWKLFGTTFVMILLAEMGDKTQLAAFSLAGSRGRPVTIFIAAVLALSVATAIGIIAGSLFNRYLPERVLKRAVAVLFVGIGIWTWIRA